MIRLIDYEPIIKPKGFDPQPLKRYGIPLHADSLKNPNCKDTRQWEEYWDEQIDRCLNGYYTGGLKINGRLYYYLNFCPIFTVGRGWHLPEFVDVDYEFSEIIEEVKRDGKGIIALKSRRRGLSEKAVNMEVDYGMRFGYMGYTAAVGAGLKDYVEDFAAKLIATDINRPPELRLNYTRSSLESIVAGYRIKTPQGFKKDGTGNNIRLRTMFNDPNVLKGTALNACIFEEAGENDLLELGFGATEDAFKIGDFMVGTPYVYGTGGNIKGASRGFMNMWEAADDFNLVRCGIFSQRLNNKYYMGSRDQNGKKNDSKCVNIYALKEKLQLSDEQVMGCEDLPASLASIELKKERLRKGKSLKKYYDFLQNWATNPKEAFLNLNNNNFNSIAVNEQDLYLQKLAEEPYRTYKLEWETNFDGSLKKPYAVKMIEFDVADYKKENVPDHIMVYAMPSPNFVNMDTGGIDGYDQDISDTSKSLGSMVILRRNAWNLKDEHGNSLAGKKVVVALIRCRPDRKEKFFDLCAKASVLYGLKKNTLIDAGSSRIVDYYKMMGIEQYLAKRPLAYESINSKQTHVYGFKFTGESKPRVISMIQSFTNDFMPYCMFKHIIAGLQNYDDTIKENDWDEVDALGLALVQDSVIKRQAEEITKKPGEGGAISSIGEFMVSDTGEVIPYVQKLKFGEHAPTEQKVVSSFD